MPSAFSAAASENLPNRIPKSTSPSNVPTRLEAFRDGLRDLGYVEGKNIVIEYRYAEGNIDRLPDPFGRTHASQGRCDRRLGPSPNAAKKATATIPIVMTWDYDPVGNGYVASLARPGGNITGLSILAPEISGKQLELLKEIVPKLSRVAVLGTSTVPGQRRSIKSDGTRRAGAQGAASISRDTRSQGY